MQTKEQISMLKNVIRYLYDSIATGESYLDTLAYMPISSEQAEELGLDFMVQDLESKGK